VISVEDFRQLANGSNCESISEATWREESSAQATKYYTKEQRLNRLSWRW